MLKRRFLFIFVAAAMILLTLLCLYFAVSFPRAAKRPPAGNDPAGGDPVGSSVTIRFPGEFEKQQAIWVQWPSAVYNSGSDPVNPVMVNIIKALASYIQINVLAADKDEIGEIGRLLDESGYSGNNVKFYVVDHYSIWARDVGPLFVLDNQSGQGGLKVVNFGFNNYSRGGDPTYINTEGQVDRRSADLLGLPVVNSNLISEGGAIESNGQGVLMTTESVVLKRNQTLSRAEIEAEYGRVLGVRKIIWLKNGLSEDDRITSGHINEIARFADPGTILLGQVLESDRDVNPAARSDYERLEENFRILESAVDQNGSPFRIIRIPMPPTLYNETDAKGSLPVRSYLNYAVTNGAVLAPSYWRPGRSEELKATEARVKETLQSVFPGRDIIFIDAGSINLWGGGIHCVTQHMPAL